MVAAKAKQLGRDALEAKRSAFGDCLISDNIPVELYRVVYDGRELADGNV